MFVVNFCYTNELRPDSLNIVVFSALSVFWANVLSLMDLIQTVVGKVDTTVLHSENVDLVDKLCK